MSFSGNLIDHVIIDEQYVNTYLEVRDRLSAKEKKIIDMTECEAGVDKAVRECMNGIDWTKEKDATGVVLRAMFRAFADYCRRNGMKYEWSIGKPDPKHGYPCSSCSFRIVGIAGED